VNPFKISDQLVDDTLCTALEGGITYWAAKADPVAWPEGAESRMFPGEPAWASELLSRGVDIVIELHPDWNEARGERHTLTLAKFKKGIRKLCELRKVTPAALEDDPLDADGADVAVQLALFGEVVYG
jgi:hypothetical protein